MSKIIIKSTDELRIKTYPLLNKSEAVYILEKTGGIWTDRQNIVKELKKIRNGWERKLSSL